jgi:acetyltransferase-like isoleucine patch superfamily enzyme
MLIKTVFMLTIRVRNALLTRWWNIVGRFWFQINDIDMDGRPTFYGYPIISLKPSSKVSIGKGVVLCSDSRFTALGVSKPVIIRTLRPNASITIGSNSGLSGVAICAAESVEIGSECLLGADVQIFDTDFHKIGPENRRYDSLPENIPSAPVVIEDNVFLGVGCKVMKGVRIGRNSIIGAGAIVTKDIPADSIAVGNPAKVIGRVQ